MGSADTKHVCEVGGAPLGSYRHAEPLQRTEQELKAPL